jgi:hypothetical protein
MIQQQATAWPTPCRAQNIHGPRPTSCEVTPAEANLCRNHHRALVMLVYFRQTYGSMPFPCVPETIGPLLCMNHKTARQERDFLLKADLIETCRASAVPRSITPGRKATLYTIKKLGEL